MNNITYLREKENSLGLFSNRDRAYIEKPAQFSDFISHQPDLAAFHEAIAAKAKTYVDATRAVSIDVIQKQYEALEIQEDAVSHALANLRKPDTFAIITAHQPCLMTGPLYFIYKIVSAIVLARSVQAKYPEHHIVPIYVIGSEDHDFDEINHFRLYQQNIEWSTTQTGAVGRMMLENIESVLDQVEEILGNQSYSADILSQLKLSYKSERTLAEATAHFVYTLFGRFGLVVADMDDDRMKQVAIPLFERELADSFSKPLVEANQSALNEMGFDAQIHARDINLFHLTKETRMRITRNERSLILSDNELNINDLKHFTSTNTKSISPNVVLRPLYQQLALPGIAYVGGGAEVAYWMEVKNVFDTIQLPFPVLVRRDSALWIKSSIASLMKKTSIGIHELFSEVHRAQERYLLNQLSDDWSLNEIKAAFDETYNQLFLEISQIDSGLVNMAKGFQSQHHNFIVKAESKLKKSLKSQHDVAMNRISKIWQDLFPGRSLQERSDSFLSTYAQHGPAFIDELVTRFNPLESGLHVFIEE